jgi:hypothetical protein
MITKSKQTWEPGETVKVGFLSLRVLAKQATPGDYKPDAYILTNKDATKFYRFVPHNGLEGGYRSMAEALAAI